MVITYCTDQTVEFEARFPDNQLLEKHLNTLKTLLPETPNIHKKMGMIMLITNIPPQTYYQNMESCLQRKKQSGRTNELIKAT